MKISEKSILLFDLDGTLIDSGAGVTRAVQHSLTAVDMEKKPSLEELIVFIGPPLRGSYKKHFGFSDEQAELAVAKFREYYSEKGVREYTPYGGIDVLLRALHAQGKTLLVASSKMEGYVRQIMEEMGLADLFTCMTGSMPDGSRVSKTDVIRLALERVGVTDLNRAVLIGDSRYDVAGARDVGMDVVGVLYGFGSRDELEEAGADVVVESVAALADFLGV